MPTRTLLKPESWPAGHRAALAILVDMDTVVWERSVDSPIATEAGAARLLTMMADLDITPTAIIDPGANHRFRVPEGITVDPAVHILELPADLADAQLQCEQRLGGKLTGVDMLGGRPGIALEQQDLWLMDGRSSPYPQRTANNQAVLPYQPYWHDATWWSTANPTPPSAMLETWSLSLASVRARGELMTVMLSSELSGLPGHVETIQRFLDDAIGAGDVWIANASEIAHTARWTDPHDDRRRAGR
jgi:hypothetical protein